MVHPVSTVMVAIFLHFSFRTYNLSQSSRETAPDDIPKAQCKSPLWGFPKTASCVITKAQGISVNLFSVLRGKGVIMQGRPVECPVCGTKMMIPPGYEKMAARCRACNTVLNQGPQLAMAGIGVMSQAAPIAQPAVQTQSTTEYIRCQLRSGVLSAFLWGSAGAVAGGVIVALISIAIVHGSDATQVRAAVYGGAEFGMLAGFLLGSVWGLVSSLDLSYAVGTGIAATLGLVFSVSHHLVETALIAPPNEPVYMTGIVGIGAGAFIGCVSVWYKDYREDAA
jgi:hypothetical protein